MIARTRLGAALATVALVGAGVWDPVRHYAYLVNSPAPGAPRSRYKLGSDGPRSSRATSTGTAGTATASTSAAGFRW